MDTQSARQKTRRQYEDFEKQLIRLDKLRTALWRQKQSLGWEPLHPPVMRGWKRSFVLREDVAQESQAAFFEGILEKINTFQYSSRKDFTEKKRKWGRKVRAERVQQLLKPSRHHMLRWQLTNDEWAFFAYKREWSPADKRMIDWYEFTEPWRFVLRIEQNIITQVRIRDEALEAEIARLDNYIEQRNLNPAMAKIKHGYTRRRRRQVGQSGRDKAIIKSMEQSWQNYKSGERI